MIALKITKLGAFMGKLLSSDCFDSFLLEEASVSMGITMQLDGHLNRSFYTKEEWEVLSGRGYDLTPWKNVRPLCHEFIKGKKAPAAFHIVLHLNPEAIPSLLEKGGAQIPPEQIRALLIGIRYDGTGAVVTTGVSTHTFTLDKSADGVWDQAVQHFFTAREISYEVL